MSGDLIEAWTRAMATTPILTADEKLAAELATLREDERQARLQVLSELGWVRLAVRHRAWRRRLGVLLYASLAVIVIEAWETLGVVWMMALYAALCLTWGNWISRILRYPIYGIDDDLDELAAARGNYVAPFDALVAFEAEHDPALIWPELHPVTIEEAS